MRLRPRWFPNVPFLLLIGLLSPTLGQAGLQQQRDPGIEEGIRLHDQGLYEQAIEQYRLVLARTPNNVEAYYEMALTYQAMKDYASALEAATKGSRFKGPVRPLLHMLIGNIQDQLGNAEAALKSYRAGIREDPSVELLHFNLGVALLGRGSLSEARTALQQAVVLSPGHASAHFYLGLAYGAEGSKVPALLAYTRFLLIEPETHRSRSALEAIDDLFKQGYAKDAANGHTTLSLNPDSLSKDGDFGTVEIAMLLAQAASDLKEAPEVSQPQPPASVRRLLSTLTVACETVTKKPRSFAGNYYLPYFQALGKANLLEVASYVANQGGEVSEVVDWVGANRPLVDRLAEFSNSYQWPKTKVKR